MKTIIKREFLFFIFLFLLIVLSIFHLSQIPYYIGYIDFPTIRALIGLLLITLAIKESNFFDWFSLKIIKNVRDERNLAISLIILSTFLSMFITNDIALFVVVPITVALGKYIPESLPKLIIFEAIAVNVGSTLTPIGNPQNIFIYRNWDHGFIHFMKEMFPLFLIMFLLLLVFVIFTFQKRSIDVKIFEENKRVSIPLFLSSLFLFILFIIAMELHIVRYFLFVVIIFYLIVYRQVFLKFDYFLIFTFILMFIDFHLIANLEFVKKFITYFDLNSFFVVFNLSVLSSQIMSNVPASIFMVHFSKNYLAIADGVNLGGNGFLIASMANIIALRFYKGYKIYFDFHKYSVPFFILSYCFFVLIFGKSF